MVHHLTLSVFAQQWCKELPWLELEAPVSPVSKSALMKAWNPSASKAAMTLVACGNLRCVDTRIEFWP